MEKKAKGDFTIFTRGKGGWIRVVEAFVAVLLITGIILVVLGKGYVKGDDPSEEVYEFENGLLKEIQLNDTLRQEVLNGTNSLPINWGDFPSALPEVSLKIQLNIPSYLTCQAKVCELSDNCFLGFEIEKSVYAKSVAITEDQNNRKLKLFCWEK